jgi:DNA (cytosine-5)-methyltransferase 1
MNYYNEFDKHAAAWLRELIKAGLIPAGEVDERSITEVQSDDLDGFNQCHFFAGIGGWSYALQLAGVSSDAHVWTGSCPCQPFSCAGKQRGVDDERHVWPAFHRLIAECKPPVVFGEQVASAAGRDWLTGVRTDLERVGYAVGAADLCAAGVGAPHIRQRLYWVADAKRERSIKRNRSDMLRRWSIDSEQIGVGCFDATWLADSASTRPQGQWREYRPSGEGCSGFAGLAMQTGMQEWNGPTIGLKCSDRTRRASAQPGSFPLAHGIPARVGRLRGYGNAIVPQTAQAFIEAFMECNS